MDDLMWTYVLLAAHALLSAIAAYKMYINPRRINMVHMLWVICMPIVGPICAFMMLALERRDVPREWMEVQTDAIKTYAQALMEVDETVSIEEALLVNDARQRRKMIMSVLRSDPMEYLDLLLVARFNEDSETAHYAASTIMELQRQMQLSIQAQQAEVLKDPQSLEAYRGYIEAIEQYCDSGLLEGQLLRRQRLILAEGLEQALAIEEDKALMVLAVRNYLELDQAIEAQQVARQLIDRWPEDEEGWLAAVRVAVQTQNKHDLHELIEKIRRSPIDWSQEGRDQMALWMGDKS